MDKSVLKFPSPAPAVKRLPQDGDGPVILDAEALFASASEIRLMHRGAEYRLRITRQGKLILTK